MKTRKKACGQGHLLRAGALLMLALVHAAAHAAPILDQEYVAINPNGGALIVSSTQSVHQSFTTGITGQLTEVQVQLARNVTLPTAVTFSIVSTVGGTPDLSAILASATIDPASIGTSFGFVSVDLSAAALTVAAGDILAISLSTDAVATGGGINPYAWGGQLTDPYAGGRGFFSDPPLVAGPRDFGFRTFVDDDVSVPEPGTLALMGIALIVGTRLRKR